MKSMRFLNKAAYQALVAAASATPVATDAVAVAAHANAVAKLAAYHAEVAAVKASVGTTEVELRVRKAIMNGDNVTLVTATSDNNPFHNGTVNVSKKMLVSWANDQGIKPAAYLMLINQGQTRMTGTVRVVDANDTYETKAGITEKYQSPSMRIENQSIELGGVYGKVIQTAIANAAVKAAMGAFDATDDADIDFN